jgi:hypothetical protein
MGKLVTAAVRPMPLAALALVAPAALATIDTRTANGRVT